jgi:hypothetical protein
MATTTKSIHRSTVTLRPPKSVPALIVYAQGIVKRMTGNPSFPSPAPALAAVMTGINELQIAETAALSRIKGAIAVRDEKRVTLVTLLQQVRAHIQVTADADPTNAAPIIESAGVAVRKTPTRRARAFAAKPGPARAVDDADSSSGYPPKPAHLLGPTEITDPTARARPNYGSLGLPIFAPCSTR